MTVKPKRTNDRSDRKLVQSDEPPGYWERVAIDGEDAAIEKAGTGTMEPGVRVNVPRKPREPDTK